MARKKIVFIIVEGPSDDEALGVLLDKIFDKNKVYVHIVHGDITTDKGTNSGNVLNRIGDIVRNYARSNHLTKTHFQQIVHIVDMDGAYIPDSDVKEDSNAESPIYSLTNIRAADIVSIQLRNDQKRGCLDRMSIADTLWGIPYQVYYMSCNLDHVLYNIQNADDRQKESLAVSFARRYRTDIDGFIKMISESPFSVRKDYLESWKFIKEGRHSLERHTNLGICISRAMKNEF